MSCSIFFPMFKSQFSLQNNQKSSLLLLRQPDGWHSRVDYVLTLLAADVLFYVKCVPAGEKTLSATMTQRKGLRSECDQHINSVQTSAPLSLRAGRRAESVTPLQRSFREMNGADILRGPRTARLTDFYQRKWNLFWLGFSFFTHKNTQT